tara:strand:+ start:166 stop:330 length:165 start_codon:yes stop_codon:yes gene_type:complete
MKSKETKPKVKKQSEWITHVKSIYAKELKKDKNFKYKDAMKLAKSSYKKKATSQ